MITTATADRPVDAVRALRGPGLLFAAGLAVHGADHLHRGMMASPPAIMVAGTVQIVLVVATLVAVWRGVRWAPAAAVSVAALSIVGFGYAHLLPAWFPAWSDSYVTGARIGVTWFSWVTVAAETGTAAVFGLAALRVARR